MLLCTPKYLILYLQVCRQDNEPDRYNTQEYMVKQNYRQDIEPSKRGKLHNLDSDIGDVVILYMLQTCQYNMKYLGVHSKTI